MRLNFIFGTKVFVLLFICENHLNAFKYSELIVNDFNQSNPFCMFSIQNEAYVCELKISNENSSADFLSIDGYHYPGFTNANVTVLRVIQQLTLNIPLVICRNFPNLQSIYIVLSKVSVIDENSLENCKNLLDLQMYMNDIHSIPASAFMKNIYLHLVDFSHNNIVQLSPGTFKATALRTLNLNTNSLMTFDGTYYTENARTLNIINLHDNFIYRLPIFAFSNLYMLEIIDLSTNYLQDFPDNVFHGLNQLRQLILYENQLSKLRHAWFNSLDNLEFLQLEFNEIETLPAGIFSKNNRLKRLWMSYNKLKVIDSRSFGNLRAFEGIYLEFNAVSSIDEVFYDRAVNLFNFFLYDNSCISTFFTGVNNTRELVRNALRPCFDNFVPPEHFIECEYLIDSSLGYTCNLLINNEYGDEFDFISGEHLDGFDNLNTLAVGAFSQNTQNIPSIICRQFENLHTLHFEMSRISELTRNSFEYCKNLEYLNLPFNEIILIPERLFIGAPKLVHVDMFNNNIKTIERNAFAEVNLIELLLDFNELIEFDAEWFGQEVQHLKRVHLDGNKISNISSQLFSSLQNLQYLFLSTNPIMEIALDAFNGLVNLSFIGLNDCGIKILHTQWFRSLTNLKIVHLKLNEISEIPGGVFENLTHVYMSNNKVTSISSNSFGDLETLVHLDVMNNHITEVDEKLYNNSISLYTLQMLNNVCVSRNIVNMPLNREYYRAEFEACFENYQLENYGFIECEYEEADAPIMYVCMLNIYNPRGNDGYEDIEGNHLDGFGDENVLYAIAHEQVSLIVPSIICNRFVNLQRLYFGFSGLEEFRVENFENCRNLEYLNVESNNLRHIPDYVFGNLAHLRILNFNDNQLNELNENSLIGTSISTLKLDSNPLVNVQVNWFSWISTTLQILSISNISATELPENAFSELKNLRELDISHNNFQFLPNYIFHGLSELEQLILSHCGITSLNPLWLVDLEALEAFIADHNKITEVPSGMFSSSSRLSEINLNTNFISILNSKIFDDLSNLLYLSAMNNQIESIDPKLFDGAENLYLLFLFGNICVDDNFISVVNNRESVRQALHECLENYT